MLQDAQKRIFLNECDLLVLTFNVNIAIDSSVDDQRVSIGPIYIML